MRVLSGGGSLDELLAPYDQARPVAAAGGDGGGGGGDEEDGDRSPLEGGSPRADGDGPVRRVAGVARRGRARGSRAGRAAAAAAMAPSPARPSS